MLSKEMANDSNAFYSTSYIDNKRRSIEDDSERLPIKKRKTTTILGGDPTSTEMDVNMADVVTEKTPTAIVSTRTTIPTTTMAKTTAPRTIYGTPVNRQLMLFSNPLKNNNGRPTFLFRTKDIFGSDRIRNAAEDTQVAIHVLKNMLPKKFPKWRAHYTHLPKRIGHMKFIPAHMQKYHPTGSMVVSLNGYCPRKVVGVSLNDTPLVNFSIPYHNVSSFAKYILGKVLPWGFLGSEHNWKIFFDRVELFIALRKNETLRTVDLLQNIEIRVCRWPPSEPISTATSDLMAGAMYWIFNDYIVRLLKTCFYITDHTDYGQRLFYFRHDDWIDLSKRLLAETLQKDFTPINMGSTRLLRLGSSSVRLLPKKKGARLITNMNNACRMGDSWYKVNNNAELKNVKTVLQFEKDRQTVSVGSGSTTIASIVERVTMYKKKMKHFDFANTGFYFSKVDISRCFNSIDQDKLMNALQYVFVNDEYLIQTYRVKKQIGGRIIVYSKSVACDPDDPHDHLPNIAQQPNATIEKKAQINVSAKSLLELLEEHVKRNTVMIGNKSYQQKKGISQGSCISSILCEVFLGHLESMELHTLKSVTNGILLRYVDDFLYISNEKNDVRHFETMITKGFERFGFRTSGEKSCNNLEQSCKIKEISWCGLNIATSNLDIYNGYTDVSWAGLKNSLAVSTKDYNQALLERCRSNIQRQLCWLRKTTNSRDSINRVIYEAAVVWTAKLILYRSELSTMIRQPISDGLVIDAFREAIKVALPLIPDHIDKKHAVGLMIYGSLKMIESRHSNMKVVQQFLKIHRKTHPISKRIYGLSKDWCAL